MCVPLVANYAALINTTTQTPHIYVLGFYKLLYNLLSIFFLANVKECSLDFIQIMSLEIYS